MKLITYKVRLQITNFYLLIKISFVSFIVIILHLCLRSFPILQVPLELTFRYGIRLLERLCFYLVNSDKMASFYGSLQLWE